MAEILNKDDYFPIFDLTFGYHHIEIHPEHHKFLSLESTFKDGSTRYFQFCVLLFGFALACHVFAKDLGPFTKRWRERGIKAIIFIDDSIAAFCGFEITKSISELVRNDLPVRKTNFSPKTKEKWLGTITGTRELTVTDPQENITKRLEDITKLLNQEFLTPKQLSKIAGQRSSIHLEIDPLVRLFNRNMYHFIENRISWLETKIVSRNVKEELKFWSNNINNYNGCIFKFNLLTSWLFCCARMPAMKLTADLF